MKASYNWLKEFVDFTAPPDELAHALTMAGLEVEGAEKTDNDTVLDINITPNRPDCLSIMGIAREISAILEIPLREMKEIPIKGKGQGPSVAIENTQKCFRYSSRILRGVKPAPSPEWLKNRLESCGIRSLSNIVDITNYVLLETGQPLHAFDLGRLAGDKITVKESGDTRNFTTLDSEERSIAEDMLMIWDPERPIAIAGVMGGQNTEVTDATTDILLESACFSSSTIRRTSSSLNLSSDSSYRFERGVDMEGVTFALDRAAQMISEIAGGSISSLTDIYPEPYQPRNVLLKLETVRSLTGVDISRAFIEKTLASLGFKTAWKEDVFSVVPPSFRNDIERDIDITEEIIRLYGYDKIPSTMPTLQMSAAPEHKRQHFVKCLKDSMIKSGFSEAINYSFINPEMLNKLQLPPDDERRKMVHIKNPLRKEESAMRTTLLPSLLNNLNTNLNHGVKEVSLFEISNVFMPSDNKLPYEMLQLAVIYHRGKTTSIWESRHNRFYDLKGMLENIFYSDKINRVNFFQNSDNIHPYYHPGQSCLILIDEKPVGSIGMLHPSVTEAFDITGDTIFAEIIDISKLLNYIPEKTTFVQLPKFPYAERDIALVVSDNISVSAVHGEILAAKSELIESVHLFDIYKGKNIPEDKKSIAFSIRYRSSSKTLTDAEVDSQHSQIIKRLQTSLNASLRR